MCPSSHARDWRGSPSTQGNRCGAVGGLDGRRLCRDGGRSRSAAVVRRGRGAAYHCRTLRYGEVQWDASLVAYMSGDDWIGTTLVTRDRGRPLLAFALVAPEWR